MEFTAQSISAKKTRHRQPMPPIQWCRKMINHTNYPESTTKYHERLRFGQDRTPFDPSTDRSQHDQWPQKGKQLSSQAVVIYILIHLLIMCDIIDYSLRTILFWNFQWKIFRIKHKYTWIKDIIYLQLWTKSRA